MKLLSLEQDVRTSIHSLFRIQDILDSYDDLSLCFVSCKCVSRNKQTPIVVLRSEIRSEDSPGAHSHLET